MAITAPIVEIQSGLMIRPTRRTAMPIAKPIGQSVGDGRCGSSGISSGFKPPPSQASTS